MSDTLPFMSGRWMLDEDLAQVAAIERVSFHHPWDVDEFRLALSSKNVVGLVFEVSGAIRGYCVYVIHCDQIQILTMAVAPVMRRRGLGTMIAAYLVIKLRDHRRPRITTIVSETNLPAQLYLRSCGFRATVVLRGHCEPTGEDAYLMEREYAAPQEG